MSIEDDIATFMRVPALRMLGQSVLQVIAIGAEQRDFRPGDVLFRMGEEADAGFVVKRGSFRVAAEDAAGGEVIARPGDLLGELALLVAMVRPSTATALESSSVLRVSRSLFQRVLESHPQAAKRLHDDLAARTNEAVAAVTRLKAKLI